jgi:hypothetical protein
MALGGTEKRKYGKASETTDVRYVHALLRQQEKIESHLLTVMMFLLLNEGIDLEHWI